MRVPVEHEALLRVGTLHRILVLRPARILELQPSQAAQRGREHLDGEVARRIHVARLLGEKRRVSNARLRHQLPFLRIELVRNPRQVARREVRALQQVVQAC